MFWIVTCPITSAPDTITAGQMSPLACRDSNCSIRRCWPAGVKKPAGRNGSQRSNASSSRLRWAAIASASASSIKRMLVGPEFTPSGYGPLLVAAAVTGPQVELGALGGVERRIVEALAGHRVDQLAVDRQPLLVGAAVTGPLLDEGAIGGPGPGHVQALAVDADGAVAVHGPGLGGRVAVAGPQLHLGARAGRAAGDVHAVGGVHAGHDVPGRGGRSGQGHRQV